MLKQENSYDFKKDLLCVHKKNVRNYELEKDTDEYEIKDGTLIVLPTEDDDVILTAARDFEDYLFTSMEVSSRITKNACKCTPTLWVKINKDLDEVSAYMGYRITVSQEGICIEGYDSRGAAQAFYYLEDLMNMRKAPFLKYGVIKKKALFSPRLTQSPFGMFEYPDEALSLIAHRGYDAIMLWIKDYNTTSMGYFDINLLCQRAVKYGIDIYIELYADHEMHPDDEGAYEYYDKMYGQMLKKCPLIKGVELIGEANHFHSRDENVGYAPPSRNYVDNIPTGKCSPGWWPCNDYPQFVKLIRDVVRSYRPDADIVFCSYNWGFAPEENRLELIRNLPTDISLNATWDMFEHIPCGTSTEIVVDYSLSFAGPGKYFLSEAEEAKKCGIKMYALANASGRTWDFGVIPYEPMPYQWIERYNNMVKAHDELGLCGIKENIHYGFHPSIIGDLEKRAFFGSEIPLEQVLKQLIVRDYGQENFEIVDKAFRLWSEAITYYPPTNEDQYGALRVGPSYPFWPGNEVMPFPENGNVPMAKNAFFGNCILFPKYVPDGQGRSSMPGVRIFDEINAFTKVADLMKQGVDILKNAKNPNENLERLTVLGKFIYRCCVTCINYKNFYIACKKLDIAGSKEKAAEYLGEMESIIKAEWENVEATIPLVQVDSRLGWEPSMEYTTDEEHLRWKLRQLDYALNNAIARFKKANEL